MPFIPHTDAEVRAMLDAIGVSTIDDLFDEIPRALQNVTLSCVPTGLTEMEIMRLMQDRAETDGTYLNFLGAGAYEHFIPAAVWQLATRGEFYSAYTPYQAEASQGTLQVVYEYQTMIASLTGLDVSNASLYDGASALAEAVLMAVRLHRSSRRILMPVTVNPMYREVVRSIVSLQDIEMVEVPYATGSGMTDLDALAKLGEADFAALVIPQPNFFGVLEPVDALAQWARSRNTVVIGTVNPTALALLVPPGSWEPDGADIAVGEGQPLGVPLSSGGPYFGFMACKQAHVRQMPGRIVGRTQDVDGNTGFTLTLQAREQHIRRSKATSNICTNQGLAVTAATIHMALLGPDGLRRVAAQSHANLRNLLAQITGLPGVSRRFPSPAFHEAVVSLPASAERVLAELRGTGVLGGFNLQQYYPELGDAILVCATETKTTADIDRYHRLLEKALCNASPAVTA